MSNYLNVNIPTFFAGMDIAFLYDGDPSPTNEKIPVEVFQYTSIPQRCGVRQSTRPRTSSLPVVAGKHKLHRVPA